MNKIIEKIIINKKGSAAILMTVLLLSSILVITLTVSNIVKNGLLVSKNQTFSTKAFFAAEAGAERILWEIRNNSPRYDIRGECGINQNNMAICFDVSGDISSCVNTCAVIETATSTLSNNAIFSLDYKDEEALPYSTTTIGSIGEFRGTKRRIELIF